MSSPPPPPSPNDVPVLLKELTAIARRSLEVQIGSVAPVLLPKVYPTGMSPPTGTGVGTPADVPVLLSELTLLGRQQLAIQSALLYTWRTGGTGPAPGPSPTPPVPPPPIPPTQPSTNSSRSGNSLRDQFLEDFRSARNAASSRLRRTRIGGTVAKAGPTIGATAGVAAGLVGLGVAAVHLSKKFAEWGAGADPTGGRVLAQSQQLLAMQTSKLALGPYVLLSASLQSAAQVVGDLLTPAMRTIATITFGYGIPAFETLFTVAQSAGEALAGVTERLGGLRGILDMVMRASPAMSNFLFGAPAAGSRRVDIGASIDRTLQAMVQGLGQRSGAQSGIFDVESANRRAQTAYMSQSPLEREQLRYYREALLELIQIRNQTRRQPAPG